MEHRYIMGKNFISTVRTTADSSFTKKFKSKKHVWTAKEKELIAKYRKGQIWKNL